MNHSSGSNQLFEDSKDAFAKSVKGESLTEKEEIMKDFYSFIYYAILLTYSPRTISTAIVHNKYFK